MIDQRDDRVACERESVHGPRSIFFQSNVREGRRLSQWQRGGLAADRESVRGGLQYTPVDEVFFKISSPISLVQACVKRSLAPLLMCGLCESAKVVELLSNVRTPIVVVFSKRNRSLRVFIV